MLRRVNLGVGSGPGFLCDVTFVASLEDTWGSPEGVESCPDLHISQWQLSSSAPCPRANMAF